MIQFKVLIPARYESSRLPGKPLVDLHGKPMIHRVVEQALKSRASEVVVATDDARIMDAVSGLKVNSVLTKSSHFSGSDRVMEVADQKRWSEDTILVNLQGDEPLMPPEVINQVAQLVAKLGTWGVATLAEPIANPEDIFSPDVVKVVVNADGNALYFSRAPIPWDRSGFAKSGTGSIASFRRHIGIYAYSTGVLRRFVGLQPSRLERIESLEQLRFLEHGIPIAVADAVEQVSAGVDTPEDLQRVRKALAILLERA